MASPATAGLGQTEPPLRNGAVPSPTKLCTVEPSRRTLPEKPFRARHRTPPLARTATETTMTAPASPPASAGRRFFRALAPLLLLAQASPAAATAWLIATEHENIRSGGALTVSVVRPEGDAHWPETLSLRLAPDTDTQDDGIRIALRPLAEDDGVFRRRYSADLPAGMRGAVRAELADRRSNRLMLVARPAEATAAPAPASLSAAPPPTRFDPLPDEEPALSAHEPAYIVFGARDGLDARFQLSFKYRLFDPRSLPARRFAPFGKLHFGYTQTSLWDLSSESKPFRDTSYRPSLFWQGRLDRRPEQAWLPSYLRGGYEHESNGRDGEKSRSIDTLFVQPAWRADLSSGRTLFFAPKFLAYLDRDDNPDIARYRGHVDWNFRYGDENAWMLSARLRHGTGGHASGQLDLSWPLREPLFSRTGGFFHIQLFSGYGETLLDYDIRRPPQLRLGFSIVR